MKEQDYSNKYQIYNEKLRSYYKGYRLVISTEKTSNLKVRQVSSSANDPSKIHQDEETHNLTNSLYSSSDEDNNYKEKLSPGSKQQKHHLKKSFNPLIQEQEEKKKKTSLPIEQPSPIITTSSRLRNHH